MRSSQPRPNQRLHRTRRRRWAPSTGGEIPARTTAVLGAPVKRKPFGFVMHTSSDIRVVRCLDGLHYSLLLNRRFGT
jgi:hypothetical protein